jgi:hypothetical protein
MMDIKVVYIVVLFLFAESTFSQTPNNTTNCVAIIELDPISQTCMKCHDGSRATKVDLRRAGSPVTFDQLMRTTNHPIGMRYLDSYKNKPREYISPASMREDVKIIDGKIGCLSCHHQKQTVLASKSNEIILEEECANDKIADSQVSEMQLCLSCHIK